ncbi:MAG TPA: hypothetical protein VFJ95_04000 [Gammaproteobacteria bacterium]|nr:hypothetical protein [Gammaproteobacteria bacterium]
MHKASCYSTRLLVLCAGAAFASGAALAAERPDFTGVWGTYREPGAAGGPQRGGARGGQQPELPLKPEAKAKVDAYRALVAPSGDTPGGFCLGTGMPGSMLGSGGYPMEIVQHDDLLVVVYEAHTEVRHIHITSRAAERDLFPDRNGYSVGRWEGDKLIVETTHLKEAVDQGRYPHSDEAKIVEEYHLTTTDNGGKVLTANMTLTDPKFYTEPIKAEKKWQFLPGTRLLPYECNEPAWEEHLEQLRKEGAGAKSGS